MAQIKRLFYRAIIICLLIPRLNFGEETDSSPDDDKAVKTIENNDQKDKTDKTDEKDGTEKADQADQNENDTKNSSGELQIIDKIIKPENDPKEYRVLIMENTMKILLISDPEADIGISSVAVDAGGIQSPNKVLGLAHLIEHSLFLGTKKIPSGKFEKYVTDNGGSTNAGTEPSITYYHFYINYDSLDGGVDRFSQMFISPLFEEKDVKKEVKAINDEHEISSRNDDLRYQRIQQETCSPDHDFHKYYGGNEKTLIEIPEKEGLNLSDECRKFFERYYSANNMAAAIYGKDSIDDLQKMAITYYGQIPNRNVDPPIYKTFPFTGSEMRKMIYMIPLANKYELHVAFQIPDPDVDYRSLPIDYIDYFLENQGVGSLRSLLKKNGWITELSTTASVIAKYIAVYEIGFSLTEEGLDKIDSILIHLFEYINLVKSDGVQESYYEEIKAVDNTHFQWSFQDDAIDRFAYIGRDLLSYDDPKHVLIADRVPFKWDPDTINEYLKQLDPTRMRVTAISQTYESICDQSEQWFGVKYGVEDIKPDLIEKLQSVSADNSKLALPESNKYISENLELIAMGDEVSQYPIIIYDEQICRAWLKQDDVYGLPNVYMSASILGATFGPDIKKVALSIMFTFLWYNSMEESVYPASFAGYDWSIYSITKGLELYITGYNDKFELFTETIVNSMMDFTYTEDVFNDTKDQVLDTLSNGNDAFDQALTYLTELLTQTLYSSEEKAAVLTDITQDDIEEFRKTMFESVFVQMFVYGNISEEGALNIVNIVESPFKDESEVPSTEELTPVLDLYLEEGQTYLYSGDVDTTTNSAAVVYYQCGVESMRNIVLVDLFASIIQTALFYQLRTQDQLGYIITTNVILQLGVQGLYVGIQSASFSPEYLHCKIDEFMNKMQNNKLSGGQLKELIASTKETYLQKAADLTAQFDEFYGQITRRTYNFAINDIRAAEVEKITIDDVLEFYSTYIKSDSENRAKLVIYVRPKNTNLEDPSDCEPIDEKPVIIEDIGKFKQSATAADIPESYEDVTPIGGSKSTHRKSENSENTEETDTKNDDNKKESKTADGKEGNAEIDESKDKNSETKQ